MYAAKSIFVPIASFLLIATSSTRAAAEVYICDLDTKENGQLRNAGINGSPGLTGLSGRFSFDFNRQSNSVTVKAVSGNPKAFTLGTFKFTDTGKALYFCNPAEFKCNLERKELDGKSVTMFSGGTHVYKSDGIMSSYRWYYADFYNAPYNDSFAMSYTTTGTCKPG